MKKSSLFKNRALENKTGASVEDKSGASRFDSFLTVLGGICGVFTLICYGSYFVKIMIFPEGTLPIAACLLVFTGLFVPFFTRRHLRRFLKRAYIPIKAVYSFVLLFFTLSFISMCIFVLVPRSETPYTELPERTVVVTFGAKVGANGSPGRPLARRLQKTLDILEACPDAVCIVSGGKGDDEPVSEASAMKSWLVERGIDSSRIIEEDRARNTLQNISYSRELIEKLDLADYSVACVSSDYHVPRIRFISGQNDGFGDFFYAAAGNTYWDFPGLVREYMSYGRLILLGFDS